MLCKLTMQSGNSILKVILNKENPCYYPYIHGACKITLLLLIVNCLQEISTISSHLPSSISVLLVPTSNFKVHRKLIKDLYD